MEDQKRCKRHNDHDHNGSLMPKERTCLVRSVTPDGIKDRKIVLNKNEVILGELMLGRSGDHP